MRFNAVMWLRHCRAEHQNGREVVGAWSTGSRRQGMRQGDRVYLLRQGVEPRGIIASGRVANDDGIWMGPHFDPDETEPAGYIFIQWDSAVSEIDPLGLDVLTGVSHSSGWDYSWTPRAGGVEIPSEAMSAIQGAWSGHLSSRSS